MINNTLKNSNIILKLFLSSILFLLIYYIISTAGLLIFGILSSILFFSSFVLVNSNISKKLFIALYFFLFFVPIFEFLHSSDINYSAYYAILVTLFIFILIIKRKKIEFDVLEIFFFYFLFHTIITWGLKDALLEYSSITYPFTAFSLYYLFSYENTSKITIYFLKILSITIVIESLLSISQSLFDYPVFQNILPDLYGSNRNYFSIFFPSISYYVKQGSGTFEHFNGLGALCALTVPIFFGYWYANKREFTRFFILIGIILGLISTFSRGALLGSIIACYSIIVFNSKFKKITFTINMFLIAILVLFLKNNLEAYFSISSNLNSRIDTWVFAIQDFKFNPLRILFGYGYNYFHKEILIGEKGVLSNLHSGLLQILMEQGVLGFLLFFIPLMKIFKELLSNKKNLFVLSIIGGIIGFLIHQFFDNAMFGSMAFLMFSLIGILKYYENNNLDKVLNFWYGKNYNTK